MQNVSTKTCFRLGYDLQPDRFDKNTYRALKAVSKSLSPQAWFESGIDEIIKIVKTSKEDGARRAVKEAFQRWRDAAIGKAEKICAECNQILREVGGSQNTVAWKNLVKPYSGTDAKRSLRREVYNAYHLGRVAKDVHCFWNHYWPQVLGWTTLVLISSCTRNSTFQWATAFSLAACIALPKLARDQKASKGWNKLQTRVFENISPVLLGNLAINSALAYFLFKRGYAVPHELWTLQAAIVGIAAGSYLSRWAVEIAQTSQRKSS